eukprot:jgi/Botrbrau1/10519/Bobra.7_1s0003.1
MGRRCAGLTLSFSQIGSIGLAWGKALSSLQELFERMEVNVIFHIFCDNCRRTAKLLEEMMVGCTLHVPLFVMIVTYSSTSPVRVLVILRTTRRRHQESSRWSYATSLSAARGARIFFEE